MKLTTIELLVLFILYSSSSIAQDMNEFQWKNRLVILAVHSVDNDNYKAQINSLKSDLEGLEIRKLRIITIVPGYQSFSLTTNTLQAIDSSYEKFLLKNDPFMFYLVGLDGGVKFSSSDIISNKKLFELIDVMPMRRLEIDNNKSQKD